MKREGERLRKDGMGRKKEVWGGRQETAQRGRVAEAAAAMATIQVLERVS